MKISSIPYGLVAEKASKEGLKGIMEWVDFSARQGLQGVEIYNNWLSYLQWEEVIALCDGIQERKLEISSYCILDFQLNCENKEQQGKSLEYLQKLVKKSKLMNAKRLSVASGGWGDFDMYKMSFKEAVNNTVKTLEACLPVAEENNIKIIIENHPGWISRYAEALLEILERIDSKYLELNLDTGSMFREGQRPEDFLKHEIVAKKTTSVHLKTVKFEPDPERGRWNQLVPFEESDIDYKYIFSKLKKTGFDGWISYEMTGGGLERLSAGAKFINKMWKEIK